jgi:glycogen debranching enzyme
MSRLLEGSDPHITAMREATVRQLFAPEMLSYNGIRTLASDELAFRPGGYHTGSVWLWDTARIADGLERHGYHHLAWNLRERIWRAAEETGRFPEFVRGGTEHHTETNPSEIYVWNDHHKVLHLFEQPPQEIQGWSVSAILAAKYRYPEYRDTRDQLPTSDLEQSILHELQARGANNQLAH